LVLLVLLLLLQAAALQPAPLSDSASRQQKKVKHAYVLSCRCLHGNQCLPDTFACSKIYFKAAAETHFMLTC
jgi:hypothetical protein